MVFPLGDQNTSTSTSGDTWKSTHVVVVLHLVVAVVIGSNIVCENEAVHTSSTVYVLTEV